MPSVLVRRSAVLLLALLPFSTLRAFEGPPQGVPPDDALILLAAGNQRYADDKPLHFQQNSLRRSETAKHGQKPFAVVLTCADSRVPPELIFDQGVGCLFVIRVAGNVSRVDEVASIEYAVGHLGTRLVVVMGHTRCGAVSAVVEEAHAGPNLAELIAPIQPAAKRARAENPGLHGPGLVDATVRTNVLQSMADLLRLSPELSLAVAVGRARVVGAIYDLESGKVEMLDHVAVPQPANAPAPGTPPAPVEAPPAHH